MSNGLMKLKLEFYSRPNRKFWTFFTDFSDVKKSVWALTETLPIVDSEPDICNQLSFQSEFINWPFFSFFLPFIRIFFFLHSIQSAVISRSLNQSYIKYFRKVFKKMTNYFVNVFQLVLSITSDKWPKIHFNTKHF